MTLDLDSKFCSTCHSLSSNRHYIFVSNIHEYSLFTIYQKLMQAYGAINGHLCYPYVSSFFFLAPNDFWHQLVPSPVLLSWSRYSAIQRMKSAPYLAERVPAPTASSQPWALPPQTPEPPAEQPAWSSPAGVPPAPGASSGSPPPGSPGSGSWSAMQGNIIFV